MSVALLGAGPVGYSYIAHVVPPPVEDDVLPVGSIYIAVVNTSPSQTLGYGTWEPFATGRVLIGVDLTNPTFDAPEKTGGTLTTAAVVADHPSHTHSYTQVVDHVHTLATGTTATGNFSQVIGTVDASSGGTGAAPTQSALATRSGNPVGSAGATGTTAGPSATLSHVATPTSVVQPSIAVFMFKRVA